MLESYDKIIIGAGLYGLYAAYQCGKKGQKVIILECDPKPFSRATYVNQARVHQGYHYPRSLSTAIKSANYFEKFVHDFDFAIHKEFKKIYATSAQYSWTNREQFIGFCKAVNIPCEEVLPSKFFKESMCDGAFLTNEYTYDADLLKNYFLEKIAGMNSVRICYDSPVQGIEKTASTYKVFTKGENAFEAPFLLNASYASTNQILDMVGFEKFKIKYELCEIILCDVNKALKDFGFTVMDGPFFSIMPFGKTGLHSLTAVTFTPHSTSYDPLPNFICQKESNGYCSPRHLGNCSTCPAKPATAFPYMANLARKYLKDEYEFTYKDSLFSMKPILMNSEIDDSRPTMIRVFSQEPTFVSVLSGKINTVYDLDEVLCD